MGYPGDPTLSWQKTKCRTEVLNKRVFDSEQITTMGRRVFVVGVGMIKFEKPGKRDWDYPKMGAVAGKKALWDAGVRYNEIDQAVPHALASPSHPQSHHSSFPSFIPSFIDIALPICTSNL